MESREGVKHGRRSGPMAWRSGKVCGSGLDRRKPGSGACQFGSGQPPIPSLAINIFKFMQNLTLVIPAKKEKESLPLVMQELRKYNLKTIIVLEENDLIIVPLMCILCVAIPFVLVTIAPRFIPAAEVNLFFLLETIIGPIWVWLIIKEQPSIETLYGGVVIIATIAIHSFLKLKNL